MERIEKKQNVGEIDVVDMVDAKEDWNRARRKLLYQKLVVFFKQCSVDLLSFEEVQSGLRLAQRLERGLQESRWIVYGAVLVGMMTSPQPFCREKDICASVGRKLT